jgi:hypothetical protein
MKNSDIGLTDREWLTECFPTRTPGVILIQYHRDEIQRLLELVGETRSILGEIADGWDYYDPDDIESLVKRAKAKLPLPKTETLTLKAVLDTRSMGDHFLRFMSNDLCQYESWGYFAQEKIINALHIQPGETITVTFTKEN